MGFWKKKDRFPHYHQLDEMDCGPTCLKIIAKYYGKTYSLQELRDKTYISREGVSLLGISDAAENIGFNTLAAQLPFEALADDTPLPCIAHWNQRHFLVVYKIKNDKVYVSDPGAGLFVLSKEEFKKGWESTRHKGVDNGTVLFLETTPAFYNHTALEATEEQRAASDKARVKLKYFVPYFLKYKKHFIQLFLGLLFGSLLSLIFPFLTQSILDIGINNQNLDFVYLILIGQLILFASQNAVDYIRSWILLHVSTRVSISIVSDFLIKLMKLPIGFFDSKSIGDILQRISDHSRVQSFLTNNTMNLPFTVFNSLLFGGILLYYDATIFMIFLVGSGLNASWLLIFMKKRKELDYKSFNQESQNQTTLVKLVEGMPEIKLNNYEKQKRWEWERVQVKLFKISIARLRLSQHQNAGAFLINGLKNILITFYSAKGVIAGEITLGMMFAIQYMVGQLNAPINSLIDFIHQAQDARISLERLGEIHQLEDERQEDALKLRTLPTKKDLTIENLSFNYGGPHAQKVLDGVSFCIPEGKTTAIVGSSGSGKTTLLKLLLKFYAPTEGKIKIGNTPLDALHNNVWRDTTAAVMQEGFLFSDTIARNIALADDPIDTKKLRYAVQIANIQEFIESLPLSYNTKIGPDGQSLSGGQKQRLLIARAVYKNPEFMFFDEATSALDTENERIIQENLSRIFQGKTAVVVAHRLSTVRNADQIIVLEKGKVAETGTHLELVEKEGVYYNLIKNQLELA